MTFRVGMPVVCIKRELWDEVDWETAPVFGGVYTIRAIDDFSEGPCLRFEEIVNPPGNYREGTFEATFAIEHFRPLIEQKSEVSFTHGADPLTHRFDNRRVKVGASA